MSRRLIVVNRGPGALPITREPGIDLWEIWWNTADWFANACGYGSPTGGLGTHGRVDAIFFDPGRALPPPR